MGMPAKISPPRLGPVYRRERLLEWLSAAQTSHAAVCISGPPGAGKTVLAADYVASSGWRAANPAKVLATTCFFRAV